MNVNLYKYHCDICGNDYVSTFTCQEHRETCNLKEMTLVNDVSLFKHMYNYVSKIILG